MPLARPRCGGRLDRQHAIALEKHIARTGLGARAVNDETVGETNHARVSTVGFVLMRGNGVWL